MVSDRLRRVMLDAAGSGSLAGDDVLAGRAEHPVCGDVVAVDVRVESGQIVDLAWRASGCPATLAVAASAHRALVGEEVGGAALALRNRLKDLGGLAKHERHAERIFLEALTRAVETAS